MIFNHDFIIFDLIITCICYDIFFPSLMKPKVHRQICLKKSEKIRDFFVNFDPVCSGGACRASKTEKRK